MLGVCDVICVGLEYLPLLLGVLLQGHLILFPDQGHDIAHLELLGRLDLVKLDLPLTAAIFEHSEG